MHPRVVKIFALKGLRLGAIFKDGSARIYDVSTLKKRFPIFEDLEAVPGLFQQVRTDCGGAGIVWNDEIDLAAEEIWYNGTPCEANFA